MANAILSTLLGTLLTRFSGQSGASLKVNRSGTDLKENLQCEP